MWLQAARLLNNKIQIHRPNAIVLAGCVAHIQECCRLAASKGWKLSVVGGGHGIDGTAVQAITI